jgi:DNA-binding transcriptional ArsR family regulator
LTIVAGVDEDTLSVTFGALADPTRRAILARLAEGDATVNELAALFPAITLQAVSKHLKVLERAGLVTRGRTAQQRPAHLRTEPLANATAFLEHYRNFYEGSLDRLAEHLAQIQRPAPEKARHRKDSHPGGT